MIPGSRVANSCRKRSGITLTEILISIMIMGIGMVSIATLFPLGLLKLRDAARFSRSTYLAESASADLAARGLLNPQAVNYPDALNRLFGLPLWYTSPTAGPYNPLIHDTFAYGGEWTTGALGSNGLGLPFAYDPLWRYQTVWNSEAIWGISSGVYLNPLAAASPTGSRLQAPEARFASGIGFIRHDPDGQNGGLPSAHGLQRLTSFNLPAYQSGASPTPVMPSAQYVPSIFVSPEDVVWQDADYKSLYPMAWGFTDPVTSLKTVDSTPSPLVPDLSISGNYLPVEDWRYTWMFTGRQVSEGSATGATFDGEIVVFENRPFALDAVTSPIDGSSYPQAAGERVVEAVFGYSTNVLQVGTDGNNNPVYYSTGASKSVLLRWPSGAPDPEVKVGSWIADVTYERTFFLSNSNLSVSPGSRFAFNPTGFSLLTPSTSGQRCHWYQVVKVNPAAPANGNLAFGANNGAYRSMIVNVATPLRALTPLNANGSPLHVNAALVSPYVVQVIPRTFTVN